MTKTEIAVSIGTGFLLFGLVLLLCVAIVVCGFASNHGCGTGTDAVPVFTPPGAVGEIQRAVNDIKYGKVNIKAAEETKDGILSRIRDRIESRRQGNQACVSSVNYSYSECVPRASFSAPRSSVQSVTCTPIQSVPFQSVPCDPMQSFVVDPSDCNASYYMQTQPWVKIQSTGIAEYPRATEYPSVTPVGPNASSSSPTNTDCPSCRKPDPDINRLFGGPRTDKSREVKTGSFACSNCRKQCVGSDWHTDWAANGTPVTFLCESCYGRMTPQQRVSAYKQYAARQIQKSGQVGLMHPETF